MPKAGHVDLYRYYDENRAFLFGALLLGQLIYWGVALVGFFKSDRGQGGLTLIVNSFPWRDCLPYALLMIVRWRWFNRVALAWVLITFAPSALALRISG